MKEIDIRTRDEIGEALQAQASDGEISCAQAFAIAGELGARPLELGQVADDVGVRFVRCQLGLYGYGQQKSIVEPAASVPPEVEQALREGLVLGRLPCAVAWAIASRFAMPKLHVSAAAERLGIRIAQCQLGGF
jgi:hypothetical protein